MKHLRKFNESETPKYEMELKDYFYDFSDNGFVVDIEGNTIKGKYTGNYDFTDSVEMFLDTVTKLKHYFGITKTSFNNSMTSTSFLIEVSNKMDDINSIEVTLKKSGKKLKLKINDISLRSCKNEIYGIRLYTSDFNNNNYLIDWYNSVVYHHPGNYTNIDINSSFKISGVNATIDLENTTKVYNLILNSKYKGFSGYELGIFKEKINPELLVR